MTKRTKAKKARRGPPKESAEQAHERQIIFQSIKLAQAIAAQDVSHGVDPDGGSDHAVIANKPFQRQYTDAMRFLTGTSASTPGAIAAKIRATKAVMIHNREVSMTSEEVEFIYTTIFDVDKFVKPMLDELWDAKHNPRSAEGAQS